MEVNPDRRLAPCQGGRGLFGQPKSPQRLAGDARGRVKTRAKTVDHRHRHHGGDPTPLLPAMEAAQIVGAHDPNKVNAAAARPEIANHIVGVAHADLGLEAGDVDARVMRERARRRDALGKRAQAAGVLERIAWSDHPPDAVEAEPPHRDQAGGPMRLMRRIEGAAEQTDAHARSVGRQNGHGLVWPEPRTRYLNVVSCSTPTGPRAWKRPVAMPISAPKPNSPPSANWVEALCSTIAESIPSRNFSAVALSSVTIESVWCEP